MVRSTQSSVTADTDDEMESAMLTQKDEESPGLLLCRLGVSLEVTAMRPGPFWEQPGELSACFKGL